MTRSLILRVLCIYVLCLHAGRAMQPADACRIAAAAAEQKWHLPLDLLVAIGRVESGRFDPATQRIAPWPWTVNASGTGANFPTRDEAIEFVHTLQTQGVRMIDVGCFQVDLLYHPKAFASVEDAFDPNLNADYAARFLTLLHAQTGNWPAAIARYHSARDIEGAAYQARVLGARQWSPATLALENTPALRYGAPPLTAPDRFVVLMSAAARAVKIIHPAARD